MQTNLGYPDASAFEPEGRMAAIEREQAHRARAIAVKAAAADYRARIKSDEVRAALELVEAVAGTPKTAEEFIDAPVELAKLAVVEGSGINPQGVRVLEEVCKSRAAFLKPEKYGRATDLGEDEQTKQLRAMGIEAARITFAAIGRAMGMSVQPAEKPVAEVPAKLPE